MMDGWRYEGGELHCEGIAASFAAERLQTPLYLYSRAAILSHLRELQEAFRGVETTICYSVKANGNLSLLRLVAEQGAAFDIVSGGELFRVLRSGARADRTVYAGVGKTAGEIRFALENDLWMFNVECEGDLEDINRVARDLGRVARVALRLNPDIAANTHHHITTGTKENKFGLDPAAAETLARRALEMPGVRLMGLHAHIGSQITDPGPHRATCERLLAFADRLEPLGARIETINIGGGFGIRYSDEQPAPAAAFAREVVPRVRAAGRRLIIEPGRYIVGNAGVLLTRVLRVKRSAHGKRFLICDAAMNDLIRPVLYDAWHTVWPVRGEPPALLGGSADGGGLEPADVVGPICESGDFLARERPLPEVQPGDLLAVFGAGAYGFSMSSNYNARPRAAEALADGTTLLTIREREQYTDMTSHEERCLRAC